MSASRAAARPHVPSDPSDPPWSARAARAFPQQRARDTHQRLLIAASEVFAARGFDETQTPEIAERAGVSVGTFYRYFSDKRQAFIELVQRELDASYLRVMQDLTPETFGRIRSARERRAAIDHVIELLFQSTAKNPRLHRVFVAMAMRDDAVAELRDEFEQRAQRALATLIRLLVPVARIPDPDAAAQVIVIAAQDLALAVAGLRGPPPTPARAAALRGALADMLYRYVFGG